MRVVTVFNSRSLYGAIQEYKPEHVYALQRQLAKWAPEAEFECLSDVELDGVTVRPLKRGWPGWWAKMELMDPALPGDFLFMDLDTVILRPIDEILAVKKLTLLRDFFRDGKKLKEGLGGGLMYLPHEARREVWDAWMVHPALNLRMYARGDQFFFEKYWLRKAARWQDEVPGQIVSWKVHCKNSIVPPAARVVCFHGQPRPWSVGPFLHLYR